MTEFIVLDRLELIQGELFRKAGKSRKSAHFRQGDLDGACGAYAVSIALNMLGVFDATACLSDDERPNPKEEGLVKALNNHGLYRKGLTTRQLLNLLKRYSEDVSPIVMSEEDDMLCFVRDNIEKNNPIILGIDYSKDSGHWLVVVGYSIDKRGEIRHLLTLDPEYDAPKYAMWNGVLDMDKQPRTKYPYTYQTMDNTRVKLTDFIAIQKL